MDLSGIHGFKGWIPDDTLGNDNNLVFAEELTDIDIFKESL